MTMPTAVAQIVPCIIKRGGNHAALDEAHRVNGLWRKRQLEMLSLILGLRVLEAKKRQGGRKMALVELIKYVGHGTS